MKLSTYARQHGISYKTAWGWYKAGMLDAYQTDTGDELVDDFMAVITSMVARLYGRRQSKRRVEKIKQCVEHVMQEEDE